MYQVTADGETVGSGLYSLHGAAVAARTFREANPDQSYQIVPA